MPQLLLTDLNGTFNILTIKEIKLYTLGHTASTHMHTYILIPKMLSLRNIYNL